MEEKWLADRAHLRQLLREKPAYSNPQLAQATGRSLDWVKKWKKRLKNGPPDDDTVLFSLSRGPKHPPPKICQQVEERILEFRDHPPDNLQRTPGPLALAYYLAKDPQLIAASVHIPTSTATIWRILTKNGRIAHSISAQHQSFQRPAPMTEWQLDYKDCGLSADPHGKKQHVVETLNIIDTGTSILVDAQPKEDFNAATTIETLAQTFKTYGRPKAITFDRDTRFVGSPSGRDFPAAFVRFLHVLNITTNICPPHRPDLNGIVERFNKTYGTECLKVTKPGDIGKVHEVTAPFKQHYNWERPHQSPPCGNKPPRVAFAELPALPGLPLTINPDGWLQHIDGQYFARKVRTQGSIKLNRRDYYVGQKFAGKEVALKVEAATQEFVVYQGQHPFKRVKIKDLYHKEVTFEEYLEIIVKEARTEDRLQYVRISN